MKQFGRFLASLFVASAAACDSTEFKVPLGKQPKKARNFTSWIPELARAGRLSGANRPQPGWRDVQRRHRFKVLDARRRKRRKAA